MYKNMFIHSIYAVSIHMCKIIYTMWKLDIGAWLLEELLWWVSVSMFSQEVNSIVLQKDLTPVCSSQSESETCP